MTTESARMPLLSIVVPTLATGHNLYRCLDSMVNNSPERLLKSAELIVFINADPTANVKQNDVEQYLKKIKSRFESLTIVRSDRFYWTAEESALAASTHANGKFLWVVGDARIFVPEGLIELDRWVQNPTAPAAYFNSIWYDRNGISYGQPSTHIGAGEHIMSYKQFVMHAGLNFMPTAMGAWVYERHFLDQEKWSHVINHCGPHFSHVTTLLATMGETPVHCHTTFIYVAESKVYHAGDDSEWVRYSRLSDTYRFYAWTLGLVRQFEYLVAQGAYRYEDIRRSMCCEGPVLRRQVDEIYIHLLGQLRYGWADRKEKLQQSEFDEIINFLYRACPEKAITNGLIQNLYAQSDSLSSKQFTAKWSVINAALHLDHRDLKFASLIVAQVRDYYIRLHPKGYIASPVRDGENFMGGYRLLDAAPQSNSNVLEQFLRRNRWAVLDESGLRSFAPKTPPLNTQDLFPVNTLPSVPRSKLRILTSRMVTKLYRLRLTYRVVNTLPAGIKKKLKSILM